MHFTVNMKSKLTTFTYLKHVLDLFVHGSLVHQFPNRKMQKHGLPVKLLFFSADVSVLTQTFQPIFQNPNNSCRASRSLNILSHMSDYRNKMGCEHHFMLTSKVCIGEIQMHCASYVRLIII